MDSAGNRFNVGVHNLCIVLSRKVQPYPQFRYRQVVSTTTGYYGYRASRIFGNWIIQGRY